MLLRDVHVMRNIAGDPMTPAEKALAFTRRQYDSKCKELEAARRKLESVARIIPMTGCSCEWHECKCETDDEGFRICCGTCMCRRILRAITS